ncbi:hypothetical protein [Nocardia transvalensis]|uniref:hypothetical protein n=1 Tax=Nocardia transvalensis TaxID=37333 RepID=UPI001893AD09|nr:hypothetical protein [Nocardia transvalensis]MBF6331703.1 hypothetical protein [Nocardia transvalensis]
MGWADCARAVRDRLLDFWVALAALAGLVLFGAATVTAVRAADWLAVALFGALALPCALIVALNILVEAADHARIWLLALGAVLIMPLLLIPAVRRRARRIWLRHLTSPEPAPAGWMRRQDDPGTPYRSR